VCHRLLDQYTIVSARQDRSVFAVRHLFVIFPLYFSVAWFVLWLGGKLPSNSGKIIALGGWVLFFIASCRILIGLGVDHPRPDQPNKTQT
jgi:hypothetical protein